ncbi:phage tail fiber protein [Aeromonas salmonicida]|uniref:phage tail fiber domain-containing protein n=1 Tax=Aeromonas salmonicida TaxID=645 RepID=UPI001EECD740|nr:phage tail fiber protein [Aeromonas salmonicida]MCE9933623.1 tail fiber domain-containing protein [Aeromonas salmonicida]
MSYYSLVKLRGAAGQSLFAFDFPYLKREDVRVFVDGTAVSFTFTSPNTIELADPLTKASDVVIRRFTETGRRLVDYNSVAELTEEVLDMDSLQAFYIVQEALDTAASAVVADIQGNWDAKRGRIINVADPVDDTDAMNRRTFFELNGAYTSKMEEWLRQARVAVNDAVEEANRARDEANRATDIQELTQAIHDGTAGIKVEAERLLTLTVEERIKAEAAVVASKEWADKSAYWYDVFRSIYLGLRSEHPGGEVVNGAVYFNTTDNRLYFYTGTQWYSPTTDADRAEAARRFVESMRNEVSNMRDQTRVYSQQAQDFVTDARDAANAAGMSAGTARNEAAAASNHAQAAEISAGVANERASASDGSAKMADAAAGRAEAAAAQVGETFGDRGGWYVAHGMPTKPMRSALWTVMDGGELDGVEWNAGDMLVYSIKTNSFGRITGTSITPSEPSPIEAEEGLILGDGKFIRARVAANIRWIAHANSEGVKLGDNAVELHLLGNNMVFGALKHPVFHKGNLPTWDDVTGKPETFPVGVHSHKWDEITGKPAAALRWPTWFEVTDKPTYFPPVTHGHSWNEITNKPDTALRWPTLAEVGAAPSGFGLGGEGQSLADKSCNDATESGFYSIYSSTTDTPYGSGPSGSGMMVVKWGGGAGCFQLFFAYTAARVHVRRRYQDAWQGWSELYSTSKKPTAADVGARPKDWVPSWDEVTGKPADYPSATHSHAWGEVTGKPTTFPPATHKHAWGDLTGVPSQATRWPTFAEVTDKPATFPPATHSHAWEDVTGKPAAFPPATHSHAWGEVTGKPTTFPPATHSHTWADVTGKPTTFPAAAHKHSWTELTDIPVYATRWPTAAEVGAADLNHGHARQFGSEQTLSTEDLDTIKTPGVYAQHANVNTSAARHYPENLAGSLIVTTGAGVQQRYHVYNTSRVWTRAQYDQGAWTPWAREYNTANKPTAAEVGAAPAGFGLGGYGTIIGSVLGDTPLRRQSGFFQGSPIEGLPTSPHTWNYVFNQAHGNAAGYFGYLAINFDCSKAWIGGQSGGVQKGPFELVKQYDRIVASGASGHDYHQCAVEVNGNTAIDSRPGIGFHMAGRFASTLHLWEAGDFRFHTQGLTSYAGIMTGNVNANDVYIRSDRRLKKNFVEVRDALRKVSTLTAYSYDKKQTLEATEYDKKEVGLIAQDVEQVLPEAVTRVVDSSNKDGTEILTLSNSALIALLVEAVKELSEKVKELEHGRT